MDTRSSFNYMIAEAQHGRFAFVYRYHGEIKSDGTKVTPKHRRQASLFVKCRDKRMQPKHLEIFLKNDKETIELFGPYFPRNSNAPGLNRQISVVKSTEKGRPSVDLLLRDDIADQTFPAYDNATLSLVDAKVTEGEFTRIPLSATMKSDKALTRILNWIDEFEEQVEAVDESTEDDDEEEEKGGAVGSSAQRGKGKG